MNSRLQTILIMILAGAASLGPATGVANGQVSSGSPTGSENRAFEQASSDIQRQLESALEELAALRDRIAEEKIPLSRQLTDLEQELTDVRLEHQQTTRTLDSRTLDLTNLTNEIKSRKEESTYLSNLLSEYIRNFESRLHIAEKQRYAEPLEQAKLAPENSNLSQQEIYQQQAELLSASLDRLMDALNGTRFSGEAVDASGLVKDGTYVLVGPAAIFKSADGEEVGTAELKLGSSQPTEISFADPSDASAAAEVVASGRGLFPLDPTLGNAHKIEATQETLMEHIQKGGPVMVPIFVLAGIAFLVALYKWIALMTVRKPSQSRIRALLNAVSKGDREETKKAAEAVRGPTGEMLEAGVEHLDEPRDLIEEVMYEKVLATRLKLQRMLPFIQICAAAAPLLGLLGTVTGIINTFKLITIFGTGDVKTLSGGISEALITTEFGLIVAIPSLLLHAFLSRKAKGVIDQMEKSAVAFVNELSRSGYGRVTTNGQSSHAAMAEVTHRDPSSAGASAISGAAPRTVHHGASAESKSETAQQVKEILAEMLSPVVKDSLEERSRAQHSTAGSE